MIYIAADGLTPRLEYTCEVLLGTILGVHYRCCRIEEVPIDAPVLFYRQVTTGNGFEVQAQPLLFTTGYQAGAGMQALTGSDPFAKAFVLLTEYFRYVPDVARDQYGRYDERHYPPILLGLTQKPVVHHWATDLYQQLRNRYPALPPAVERQPSQVVTVDVDSAFRYLHRPWWVTFPALIRDWFQGKKDRYRALTTGQDPYDVFDKLLGLPVKPIIFFLLSDQKPNNSLINPNHPALYRLIRRCYEGGATIGLHPSLSANPESAFMKEYQLLSKVVGKPITASRQHFLRYDLPQTYRARIDAGITDEYTTALIRSVGFKHGMAVPFRWYDLLKEEVTNLFLHPTMAMDRTLQRYMALSSDAAETVIRAVKSESDRVGGTFVLLLHNESLSGTGDWKDGWQQMLWQMISHKAGGRKIVS